jgi:hypothetical protein
MCLEREYLLYLLQIWYKNMVRGWTVLSQVLDWFPARVCYTSNLEFKKEHYQTKS